MVAHWIGVFGRCSIVAVVRWSLGALIAGGLVVVACSGGGDDPVGSTAPTSVVETTASAVATTDPVVTDPQATEPPPTSEVAPATTEQSTEALIAEIEADLNEGEQALFAAGADPANPELRAELERYMSGTALNTVNDFLDSLVADGFLARPSHDVFNSVTVFRIDSVGGAPASEAVVELCRVDATVVYRPSSTGEIIINDEVAAGLSRSRVNLSQGTWRVDGGSRLDPSAATEPCVVDM